MATIQNYVIYKNADWEVAARWESDGTPYILSDAELMIRRADTEAVLVSASVSGGEITLDGVNGWATVVVPEADWSGIEYTGNAIYDLKVTRSSDSRTKIILAGDVVVKKGVTY